MMFFLFSGGVALLILGGSIFLLKLGRQLGTRYLERQGTDAMAGLNAVEGAVFALMGLLLAFAISGALQRFDERRALILQEVNAINTAPDRLELLDSASRERLRPKLKTYFQARLDLYNQPTDFSFKDQAAVYSAEALPLVGTELWHSSIRICGTVNGMVT